MEFLNGIRRHNPPLAQRYLRRCNTLKAILRLHELKGSRINLRNASRARDVPKISPIDFSQQSARVRARGVQKHREKVVLELDAEAQADAVLWTADRISRTVRAHAPARPSLADQNKDGRHRWPSIFGAMSPKNLIPSARGVCRILFPVRASAGAHARGDLFDGLVTSWRYQTPARRPLPSR